MKSKLTKEDLMHMIYSEKEKVIFKLYFGSKPTEGLFAEFSGFENIQDFLTENGSMTLDDIFNQGSVKQVDNLPKTRMDCSNRPLQVLLRNFMNTRHMIAEITDVDRYKNWRSAASAWRKAIKVSGYPVKLVIRQYQLYLIKERT